MQTYKIPKRKYVDGPKKMISWRLPEKLIEKLEKVAKSKGWTTTDLVVTVLDQLIQSEENEEK